MSTNTETPQTDGPIHHGFGLDHPEDRRRLILGGAAAAFILYAYCIARTCLLGITGSPPTSLLGWLLAFWNSDPEYAHGYLVPLITAGLCVWKWRIRLHVVPLGSSAIGLWLVVAAIFLYWIGVRGTVACITAGSLIVLLFGVILYLAGWQWAKELWFPCVFLIFMIPLNFLDPLSLRLRMFVAETATGLLSTFGMAVYRVGTRICSSTHLFADLDVADPCSGLRSLVALMALASLYGYVTMDKGWKKWALFFASIPLAIIGNLARITTVALVAQGFGEDVAMKVYHDYSGYIVFSLAILCMIAFGALLNLNFKQIIYRWTQEEVATPRPPKPKNGDKRK